MSLIIIKFWPLELTSPVRFSAANQTQCSIYLLLSHSHSISPTIPPRNLRHSRRIPWIRKPGLMQHLGERRRRPTLTHGVFGPHAPRRAVAAAARRVVAQRTQHLVLHGRLGRDFGERARP